MAIFGNLLPIFAMILVGLALRRGGIIPDEDWGGIEKLAYWLFFPALLIDTIGNADLAGLPIGGVSVVLVATLVTIGLATAFSGPFLIRATGLDGPGYSSVFQCCIRWQGFIALAVVDKLYGPSGLALVGVAMAVMVPVVNVACVLALAVYASAEAATPRRVTGLLLRNPIVLGVLIGIAVNLSPVAPPEAVMTFVDIAGRAGLAAGLIVCGAGLRIRDAVPPSAPVLFTCAVKLILTPLVMAGFCALLGVDGTARTVALIAASVPTAMNGYVLARMMGGDAALYAAAATVQTALALVTMPVMLAVLGAA